MPYEVIKHIVNSTKIKKITTTIDDPRIIKLNTHITHVNPHVSNKTLKVIAHHLQYDKEKFISASIRSNNSYALSLFLPNICTDATTKEGKKDIRRGRRYVVDSINRWNTLKYLLTIGADHTQY